LFDAVFIAAPWHSSGITLMNTRSVIPAYDFVHLHVTILVTTAKHPNPIYFGRGKGDSIPTNILTSHASIRKAEEKRRKAGEKGDEPKEKARTSWWPGKKRQDANRVPHLEVSRDSADYGRSGENSSLIPTHSLSALL
jgi:prenylcysteine oxidase/farnesylcysteine lyase